MRVYNEKKIIAGLIIIVIGSMLLGSAGYVLEYKFGFLKSGNKIVQENNNSSNDNFNINTTKEYSSGIIKTINVETVSTDINIIPTKEDKVKIHFYGNTNAKNAASYVESKVNGDSLDVLIKYPFNILSIGANTKTNLDIYVPEKYKNNLEIKTTSGGTIIGNLQLDTFKFDSISGDAKINTLTANDTYFESTSGKLDIKSLLSKKNEFRTTSGDTTIENITGDIFGKSISGSFMFEYTDFNNNIDVNTISGDMELAVPKKSEFKLDFNSTSGNLKNDFSITLLGDSDKHEIIGNVGNGDKTIKIKTTSGNATINSLGE